MVNMTLSLWCCNLVINAITDSVILSILKLSFYHPVEALKKFHHRCFVGFEISVWVPFEFTSAADEIFQKHFGSTLIFLKMSIKTTLKSFLKKHKIHCYSLCDLNYRNKDILVVFSNYLLNLSFKSLTYVKFVRPTLSRFSPISIHTLLSQNVLSIENYSWCHFPLYGRFVISLSLLIFSAYLRFVIRDWTSHL